MLKYLIKTYNAIHFFLLMVCVYYIISLMSVIYAIIRINGFAIQTSWAAMTCWFLNAKLQKVEGSHEPVRNEKALILVNHRSWSDFFVHDKMMDYTANFLARYLVAIAFPISLLFSPWMRTLWYFNRDAPRKNFQKFYEWVDNKWANSQRNNLIVYPEGHRMFDATKAAPLKKGLIIYAFERKLPIQIAISIGNENLVNEKTIKITRGSQISYYIDAPIKTTDYKDFDSLFAEVQKRFSETFEIVYNAHNKKTL